MLPFEARRFVSRSGKEVVVLLNRAGQPLFWPNVFVTSEYRKASRSANTSVKVLRSLGMAQMWAEAHGRDLDHDLRVGDFLSIQDVEELANFLRLTATDQEAWAARVATPPSGMPNVLRLEDFRPDPGHLSKSEQKENDPVEAAARIRWVASYIEWHLSQRLGALDRQRQKSCDLRSVGESIVARLRQLVPRITSGSSDELALEGVERQILVRIDEAMRPRDPRNPFQPGFVQTRNYLIWRLLVDTGARRGEVREAKADHIKFSTRRFEIHVSKTIPRTVPISPITADAFDQFMEQHWSRLPRQTRRSGYLFTDENGRQLSLRAFNRIFERARKIVPGVPGFITPHTIRRSWNDQFSATIDSLPPDKRPSEDEEVKMRNRLQGWTGQSSMGGRYAKRHIRHKADYLAEALMNNLVGDGSKESQE